MNENSSLKYYYIGVISYLIVSIIIFFIIYKAYIDENKKYSYLISYEQFSYGKIAEEKSGNGELVIEILENNFNKRILSLAGNGQVGEFELIQTVSYRIKSNDKWSNERRLEAIREYTYDPALYNAAAAEESILKDSMVEQISRSIITEINNLDK